MIIFKRPLVTTFFSIVLALMLAGNNVAVSFADGGQGANGCGCRVVQTEVLAGGLQVLHIVDQNGVEYRVATLLQKYGAGHRLLFWNIKDDAQLQALQNAISQAGSSSGKGSSPSIDAYLGIPGGGWIYYTSTTMTIYISHDDAVTWETGFGFVAMVCALIAIIPPAVWAGGVCAFMSGLSALVINYYDSAGGPGFYINVTKSPFRVWLSP